MNGAADFVALHAVVKNVNAVARAPVEAADVALDFVFAFVTGKVVPEEAEVEAKDDGYREEKEPGDAAFGAGFAAVIF